MIEGLQKQKMFFEFFLLEYEKSPSDLDIKTVQFIYPKILKSVIELIEIIENTVSLFSENEKLEKLVSGLQDELLKQDELNKKLSESFKKLALITEIAGRERKI